jgi:hypothetical protein
MKALMILVFVLGLGAYRFLMVWTPLWVDVLVVLVCVGVLATTGTNSGTKRD